MDYEYRLVTKVTQGDPGDDYMGNYVVSYVTLGQWGGQESTQSLYESADMEIFNEDMTNQSIETITRRTVVVNLNEEEMMTDKINLRSTPIVGDNIIGTIPNGTELVVYIMYDNSDWLKTTYGNQTGYIQRQMNNIPLLKEVKIKVPTVTYVLQESETAPDDWETNYMDYYERKDDTYVPVEGVPDEDDPTVMVAPPWEANKYYVKTNVLDGDIEVGDLVSIRPEATTYYGLDTVIPDWVKEKNWYISYIGESNPERIVINSSEDNERAINSPIHRDDLILVRKKNVVPEVVPENDDNGEEE